MQKAQRIFYQNRIRTKIETNIVRTTVLKYVIAKRMNALHFLHLHTENKRDEEKSDNVDDVLSIEDKKLDSEPDKGKYFGQKGNKFYNIIETIEATIV